MTPQQLTTTDLPSMTQQEIADARREGRLNVLLGMDPADANLIDRAKTERLTPADVEALYRLHQHDLITAAHREGRITHTKEN